MAEFRTLPVPLTNDELLLVGDEAARLERDIDVLEAALREEIKESKQQIEGQRERLKALLRKVREKREDRRVEVKRVADYRQRRLEVVRLDTGEVVEHRSLTEDEMQGRLFPIREASDLVDKLADAVNSGALDSKDVTVTATTTSKKKP